MKLSEVRRYLHQHPELSLHEENTCSFLKSQLESLNYHKLAVIGKTGLMIVFKGAKDGRKLLLRADIDALPIQEINEFEHRSLYEGISHKCGHDGHAAIMLGVARKLSEEPPEHGDVCLIFQPAEENGCGAKAMLEDENFDFIPDLCFALHNLPAYKKHKIVCKPGSFTAAAKSIIIKLHGRTSHAAEPEKGINPGLAIAEILKLSEKLSQPDTRQHDFRLITLVHVNMGEIAYGISAGYGEVHLTLRSWTNHHMEKLEADLKRETEKICEHYNILLKSEELEVFSANDNDAEAVEIIKRASQANDLEYHNNLSPFKWGEDFGLFTEKFRGAMFGIGAGEDSPALHNPDYDFPDDIIDTGVGMFMSIINHAQK